MQSDVTEETNRQAWSTVGLLVQLAALVAHHVAVEVEDQVAGHLPVNSGQE
ncbi:MAG: hypothetical protein ETSY2_42275 [Candidatus Entotheonella gemina]|uniref:Uncharacterized protein n=1 Tax=Candidatus Entotheonella gemina TaxID=1429439 RepID=W4LN03_9BACT|nr:MAG: hypothetical protein ETSY2_42275 [Candidatus Entotheonella gemina]